jgi:hypothetical protein
MVDPFSITIFSVLLLFSAYNYTLDPFNLLELSFILLLLLPSFNDLLSLLMLIIEKSLPNTYLPNWLYYKASGKTALSIYAYIASLEGFSAIFIFSSLTNLNSYISFATYGFLTEQFSNSCSRLITYPRLSIINSFKSTLTLPTSLT